MKITESQLRAIVRQELVKTLQENEMLNESFLSKYGRYAALGAALGVGGLNMAAPLGDTSNTDLAYTATHEVPTMQQLGFKLTQNGDMVTISKGNKSIIINKKLIEQEETQIDVQKVRDFALRIMLTKNDKDNKYSSNRAMADVNDIATIYEEGQLPESKKLVEFLESDAAVRRELGMNALYSVGIIGLLVFALIAFMKDTKMQNTRMPRF